MQWKRGAEHFESLFIKMVVVNLTNVSKFKRQFLTLNTVEPSSDQRFMTRLKYFGKLMDGRRGGIVVSTSS